MKKLFMIILLAVCYHSCDKNGGDTKPDGGSIGESCFDGIRNGDELQIDCGGSCKDCDNQIGNEETPEIENSLELFGGPLDIIDVALPNLPGEVTDYNLNIGEFLIEIYNLTNSGFQFVIPEEIEPGVEELILDYNDVQYPIGNLEVPNLEQLIPSGFSFSEVNDKDIPLMLIDSTNAFIAPFFKEELLTGIYFESQEQLSIYVELNELGLPSIIKINELNLVVDGYTLDLATVNVASFYDDNPDMVTIEKNLPFHREILVLAMEQSGKSSRSGTLSDALRGVGVGLSGLNCIIGASLAVSTGGFAIPVALLNCVSFVSDFVELVDDEKTRETNGERANFGHYRKLKKLAKCAGVFSSLSNPAKVLTSVSDCLKGIVAGIKLAANLLEENKVQYTNHYNYAKNEICELSSCGTIFDINDPNSWKYSKEQVSSSSGFIFIPSQGTVNTRFTLLMDGSAYGDGGLRGTWSYNGRNLSVFISITREFIVQEDGIGELFVCVDSMQFNGSIETVKQFVGTGNITCGCCGGDTGNYSGSAVVLIP